MNMERMVMTLEVSKLSGWLNALASCARSKRRHTMPGEVRPGRREAEGATAHAECKRGLDCRFRGGHGEEHTKNIQPMVVTLEVSKLSGWLNADAP